MKIYKHDGKISHITFSIGKSWIGVDRTGIMAWFEPMHKNYYYIYKRH